MKKITISLPVDKPQPKPGNTDKKNDQPDTRFQNKIYNPQPLAK